MIEKKDQSIETLRGFAILLVVAGYIITQDITRGTHTGIAASGLRFFYYVFTPIRMPLFTVISAYLYARAPATRATFKKLVSGKARRILIPFLTVSTIQYVIFSLLPMQNHPALRDLWKVYIWPHEQLWFLYSIFEIFIIVGLLDACERLGTPLRWGFCLAVSLVLNIFVSPPHAFSLYGINYLMPFFLMGYGMRRFSGLLLSKTTALCYGVVALFSGLYWVYLYLHPSLPDLAHKSIGLVISFSAVPLIFYLRRTVPSLAKIGYYAFGIHILNRIVVSISRTIFENTDFHHTGLQFTAYMVCGVAFSIWIQILLERFTFTRKYVLGLKDRPVAGIEPAEQHFSNRFRGIEDYDQRLSVARSSFKIAAFLQAATQDKKIVWVDVPCGVGVALYEGVEIYGDKLEAFGYDLMRWDKDALSKQDLEELERYTPKKVSGLLAKDSFRFTQGDMGAVLIPQADLITSIAGIYYHDDPLAVWQNLYNRLRMDGVFVCHFMFPKKNTGVIRTYKKLAGLLSSFSETSLSFSEDSRDVTEAALITRKTRTEAIFINTAVKKVGTHRAKFGRNGTFAIKVVDYSLTDITAVRP